MPPDAAAALTAPDDKASLARGRLLLAKQLYLHGLDHSRNAGPLNKMIAVHNFHNAIEIALRAILLYHQISQDRHRSIEFERVLNAIDKHPPFQEKRIKLPYPEAVLNLNRHRNSVQHDAVEPPDSLMEQWRVLTRVWLDEVCKIYFELDFERLSAVESVVDSTLRELLRSSALAIAEGRFQWSATLSRAAFEWAAGAIWDFVPRVGASMSPGFDLDPFGPTWQGISAVGAAVHHVAYFAALVSSGVGLADLRKLQLSSPLVVLNTIQPPVVERGQPEMDEEAARWVHEFVVNTIVRWQSLNLNPYVPEAGRLHAQKLIDEGGAAVG